jgi:two-component system, NtrC family, sensor kinase
MMVADEKAGLVGSLQGTLLNLEVHQQELVSLLKQPTVPEKHQLNSPEERSHSDNKAAANNFFTYKAELLEHLTEAESIFADLATFTKSTPKTGMESFLATHRNTLKQYAQSLDVHLERIEHVISTGGSSQEARQRFLELIDSQAVTEFHHLTHELTAQMKAARSQQQSADKALTQASVFQSQIIIASILLSVAIAAILAIYTSRAITRPIRAVTHIAEQVSQDSNFDLQAPVSTNDEIGVLATTFNQLLQKVKQLLAEQQAAAQHQEQMQQTQLIESEKMSSLGRMLAGVAHEINNPVNFIYGNLDHAFGYVEDILALLDTYKTEIPHPPQRVKVQAAEIDLDFLEEDLPKVFQSIKSGAERVWQIVLSLKNFSRLDEADAHAVNLHECIESTLLILNNRLKQGITVERKFGDISTIEGFSGLLYQVFMNIISNAMDALEEINHQPSQAIHGASAQIVITTERLDAHSVVVRIADNGPGMPPQVQARIFETFFTTKPIGVGTGLGLAISRQIIEEKQGGQLTCKSEAGVGTEFAITLPITHSASVTPSD